MTLKDLQTRSLSQIIEQMEIVDLKIHSDNNGVVNNIEIKYAAPKNQDDKELNRR